MEPAKEVGGDFYDFCLIGGRNLYFAIGDVSGKGVPAALFMMITKTLLKNEALRGSSPDQILSDVNHIIAPDNNTVMFATVFCGLLDTKSGQLNFANAGHNPPLLRRKGQRAEVLSVEKGFVLGPFEDSKFKQQTIKLNPGDSLFLYTDGVTEAMNRDKKLFSEDRLLKLVAELQGHKMNDIAETVRKEVHAFAGDEPQSDDITVMALVVNEAAEV
jgi:sigma-B regulation protein RsbU (phosphoserine phosphatase)